MYNQYNNHPVAVHPRSALRLVTAPAAIVTTAEAKKQLDVTTSADDTYIDTLIAAATAQLDGKDGRLGRALGTQTWDYVLDRFPCGFGSWYGGIRIPLPPLQSVTSVKYLDPTTELEMTIAAADYTVDLYDEPGWIFPDAFWPTTLCMANAVRIRFVAGYTTVPADIKQAILLAVKNLYRSKGDVQFLVMDRVEGVGERRFGLSDQAAAMIDRAANSLLEGYRMYSV